MLRNGHWRRIASAMEATVSKQTVWTYEGSAKVVSEAKKMTEKTNMIKNGAYWNGGSSSRHEIYSGKYRQYSQSARARLEQSTKIARDKAMENATYLVCYPRCDISLDN